MDNLKEVKLWKSKSRIQKKTMLRRKGKKMMKGRQRDYNNWEMNNLRFDLLVFKEEWPEPGTEEVEQDGGREAWAVLENHLHILSHCPGKNILFILFLKLLEKNTTVSFLIYLSGHCLLFFWKFQHACMRGKSSRTKRIKSKIKLKRYLRSNRPISPCFKVNMLL